MTGDTGASGSRRPATTVALATVGFFALFVFGLGMLSLITDRDVVDVPGLGQIPGVVATIAATTAFGTGLALTVRRPHPSFWAAAGIAVSVLLAYLIGLFVAAMVTGASPGLAFGAAVSVAASVFGVVIAAAAAVAAWAGIALVRTRARPPRWPWERDEN